MAANFRIVIDTLELANKLQNSHDFHPKEFSGLLSRSEVVLMCNMYESGICPKQSVSMLVHFRVSDYQT